MKSRFLFIMTLLGIGLSADLSFIGTWGVYQGCQSGCCCPEQGALITLQDAGSDKMTLTIEEGDWSGCERYGWTSNTKLELPWDDGTNIDIIAGIATTYKDKDGESVQWIWYPIINESQEDAEGIKKGDPVAGLTSTQGSTKGCQFIISASVIKFGLGFLLLLALSLVL